MESSVRVSEKIHHCVEARIPDNYKTGEYLVTNGTPSFGTFYICSGRIELIYKNEEGFFVKEIKEAGDIIGSDNLQIHNYLFDAIALEDSEVYFFDKNFYLSEIESIG